MLAAFLLEAQGRCTEAVANAQVAIGAEPTVVHHLRARCALASGDLTTAEREVRLALDHAMSGADLAPQVTLAEIAWRRGDPGGALEMSEKVRTAYRARAAEDPELIHGLFFLRGRLFAERGDAAEAEQAFLEEIRQFPRENRSYTHLALLYALGGRESEVGPTLQRMIEQSPIAASYAEAAHTLQILGDRRSAESLLRRAHELFPGDPALQKPSGGA
jgi:tetratricopeptide (TPR) repeat protein